MRRPSILAEEPNRERLLDAKELASFFNVALATISLWVQKNRIPYVRLGGRLVRFRLSDIEAYLQRCTVPARSSANKSTFNSSPGLSRAPSGQRQSDPV
jgi:excisionase family DNA binding protein